MCRVMQAAPIMELLGLRWQGLARACGNSLYLIATLFAGPLVYYLYDLDMDDNLIFKDPRVGSVWHGGSARLYFR